MLIRRAKLAYHSQYRAAARLTVTILNILKISNHRADHPPLMPLAKVLMFRSKFGFKIAAQSGRESICPTGSSGRIRITTQWYDLTSFNLFITHFRELALQIAVCQAHKTRFIIPFHDYQAFRRAQQPACPAQLFQSDHLSSLISF